MGKIGRPKSATPSAGAIRVAATRARRGVKKADTSAATTCITENSAADTPKESFHDASLRKEIAMADQREMENAVRRGELVESALVAQEWSELVASIKNAVLAVPDRIAVRCEGESARVIRELTMTELRAALHLLANDFRETA